MFHFVLTSACYDFVFLNISKYFLQTLEEHTVVTSV